MAKILVVADDDWVAGNLATAVSDTEVELWMCSDPRRVVEAAQQTDFDLVMADMQIGNMGGAAVVRELAAAAYTGELARIPVFLLVDRSADRYLAKQAGADGVLQKPFTAQQLRNIFSSLAATL